MSKILLALAVVVGAWGVWTKTPNIMPLSAALLVAAVLTSIAKHVEAPRKTVVKAPPSHSRPVSTGEKVKKSA